MGKERNELIVVYCFGMIFLLIATTFVPLGQCDFILPHQGGGMVHQDPSMSENIWLPVPTENVGTVWYQHTLGGELAGTFGNSISGNGRIAACTFNNPIGFPFGGPDNLIIYDYYGDHIWSSGLGEEWSLNALACTSTPLVDIHDRVIACDNYKIIMVNASDRDNVYVEWISEIPHTMGLLDWYYPVPFSPTLIENKTIILPTQGGPVFAYDVDTGEKIAEIKLGNNSVIDPYFGVPDMNFTNFMTVMLDYVLYSICPYRYDSGTGCVEWNSSEPYGIMPLKIKKFYDGDIVFFVDGNIVSAYRNVDADMVFLAENAIDSGGIYTGEGYFSTINSATAEGNRIYLATGYQKPGTSPFNGTIGRLYAVDVFHDAADEEDRLVEVWNYTYYGDSQSTPTLIDDCLYFDSYNGTIDPDYRDPHIYAVYTNGTEKWKRSYANQTYFTFSTDPRGGFWYVDTDEQPWIPLYDGGRYLVRFSEEDGGIIEQIDVKELIDDTSDVITFPFSCLTIGGTKEHPIMFTSVNHRDFIKGKWVVAINLTTNTAMWQVPVEQGLLKYTKLFGRNAATGAYTILTEGNESRVLFPTNVGGMQAIGIYPDCWFEDVMHTPQDSDDINTYPDSVDISFTVNTSATKDKIFIRALLISEKHPILHRYMTEQDYLITDTQGIQDTLTISLPKYAPGGNYQLKVFLYNSSGKSKNEAYLFDLEIFDYFDNGKYADETYEPSPFYMFPPNDQPDKPGAPTGSTSLKKWEKGTYSANTIDPNDDKIYYQFNWRANKLIPHYSPWYGPYNSGQSCQVEHAWMFAGTYDVRVRAKDQYDGNPTAWSSPLTVTVGSGGGGGGDGGNDSVVFSFASEVAVGHGYSYSGFDEGYGEYTYGCLNDVPYEWYWDFGDGTNSTEENPVHVYEDIGEYTVSLRFTDHENDVFHYCDPVNVVILKANFEGNPDSVQPGVPIYFNDTSAGGHDIIEWDWDFGDNTGSSQQNTTHIYTEAGKYLVTIEVTDDQYNTDSYSQFIQVESIQPEILMVTQKKDIIGCSQELDINADFLEADSGVDQAFLTLTFPDNHKENISLSPSITNPADYSGVISNTQQRGRYNYTIWVVDNANNSNNYSGFYFIVSQPPNQPEDPYPFNGALSISTSPILSVLATDPEEELLDVTFYQKVPTTSIETDSEAEWNQGTFVDTTTDGSGALQLDFTTNIYGDGSEGKVTFTEDEILDENKNYADLIINQGVKLDTQGNIIRVSGTLTNYGEITDDYSGGPGGAGGTGGYGGQGVNPHYLPSSGSYGSSGVDGYRPGAGDGGTGGHGGAGGGGAYDNRVLYPYEVEGGAGGNGGAGGKGGGVVLIYAHTVDNVGVIHANGSKGFNGESGENGVYDYYWGGIRRLDHASGCGGGGEGGNGGAGGTALVYFANCVSMNGLFSDGGKGGSGGSDGYSPCGQLIYASKSSQIWECGASGISGGGRGDESFVHSDCDRECYPPGSDDGIDGDNGAGGYNDTIPQWDILSGWYYKTINAGTIVDWNDVIIDAIIPDGTNVEIIYGENSSGLWKYYHDFSDVPDSQYLKLRMNLSTNYHGVSPSIRSIILTYDRIWINTISDVTNGSYAECLWENLERDTTYTWQVAFSDGQSQIYGPMWNFTTFSVHYTITDLGVLGEETNASFAYGLNNNGVVVGSLGEEYGLQEAFQWDSGVLSPLGMLDDGLWSRATAVNDDGVVVGSSHRQVPEWLVHACVWVDGTPVDLGALGGMDCTSYGLDVNNDGIVVGYSYVEPNQWGPPHAFLWDGETMVDLGMLPGDDSSRAESINDNGIVVGKSSHTLNDTTYTQAFLWEDLNGNGEVDPGEMHSIDLLSGDTQSTAYDINNNNQVVGHSYGLGRGEEHAFLWQETDVVNLGSLGGIRCYAKAINDQSAIVGSSETRFHGPMHAFYWSDTNIHDLNYMIEQESGWQLHGAFDINNQGQIIGYGNHNGQIRAFLLDPLKEKLTDNPKNNTQILNKLDLMETLTDSNIR